MIMTVVRSCLPYMKNRQLYMTCYVGDTSKKETVLLVKEVNKQKSYSMPFSQKTVSTIFCFSILFWPSRHERTLEQKIRNTLTRKC